jgi:hypothetical protein
MGAYLPTDGYNKPFYCLTFGLNIQILADALEGSKLGHRICRRSANKHALFYIHQGLFSEFTHMQHMYDKCKLRTFLIFLMASWLVICYDKTTKFS